MPIDFSLILILVTAVQSPQAPAPTKGVEPATIRGIVIDSATGEGLPETVAQLTPGDRRADALVGGLTQGEFGRTDAGGRFELKDIDPGRYRLTVARNGYVTAEFGQPGPGRPGVPLELEPGEELDVSFAMEEAALITGRVYNEQGQPMPRVSVAALRAGFEPGGQVRLRTVASATTDDRGRYRLFWLTPGEYLVSAGVSTSAGIGASPNLPPARGHIPTLYPGTVDLNQAAPIVLEPGDLAGNIDFNLRRSDTFSISGRVTSFIPDAVLGGSTSASLLPAEPALVYSNVFVSVDSDGLFQVSGIASGTYELQVRVSVADGTVSTSTAIEVRDRDIEGLQIQVGPVVQITGRLYIEERAQAAIEPESGPEPFHVSLVSEDNTPTGIPERVDENGIFALEGVFPGRYVVRISGGTENHYHKSTLFNDAAVPDAAIEVVDGGSLDILVSPNGGRVEGVATRTSGDPFPGSQIVAVPEDRNRGATTIYRATTAGDDGRFSVAGLRPGRYTLFAVEYFDSFEYYAEDFTRRMEAWGQPIEIEDGGRIEVALPVAPPPQEVQP